ncbi:MULTISPECIES: hypothetical protein [unclassified Methylobacterium]|uniref:hypothetical protein n=1 Tax=unclassified Methylobacterium TaxID=2615210 RepID=UPI002269A70C|nr:MULTISPECIES: hypothetical protein [unclassified Methylobacterium]
MDDGRISLDWHTIPDDDPVERVARALCAHDGIDPDAVLASERRAPVIGPDGIAELRPVGELAWRRYTVEATRLVAAFRAFARV